MKMRAVFAGLPCGAKEKPRRVVNLGGDKKESNEWAGIEDQLPVALLV
jgi:hypothetical protein